MRQGCRRSRIGCLPAATVAVALALLAAVPEGRARALVEGDVVVAGDGGVVAIDPASGVQTRVSPVGALTQPVGIALTPDRRLLVIDPSVPVMGNPGRLYRLDPASGAVVQIALDRALPVAWDVERARDGTVWVVGDGLWSIAVVEDAGTVTERVAGAQFGRGFGLSLVEDEDGLDRVRVAAGEQGIFTYVVATGSFTPASGTPTPDGNTVTGVAEGNPPLFLFTQYQSDGFECASPTSGVYAFVVLGFGPLSTGGLLACPKAIARRGDGALFVADETDFFGTARLLELTFDAGASAWQQRLVTSAGDLSGPWDVEVVPEPAAGAASASLAVLGLAAARRGARARRHLRASRR